MSRNHRQPLTDHIREVMLDHREPYVLGSWERFQKYRQRKRRNRHLKNGLRIAATVLIIFSFVYASNFVDEGQNGLVVDEQSVKQPEIMQNPFLTPFGAEDLFGSRHPGKTDNAEDDDPIERNNTISAAADIDMMEISSIKRKTVSKETFTGNATITAPKKYPFSEEEKSEPDRMKTFAFHLNTGEQQSHNRVSGQDVPVVSPGSPKKNFTFSVGYASIVHMHESQTDFGMGGGFYSDWNFSDHLAFSSGMFIAQNQLTYSRDHENLRSTMESETTLSTSDNLKHIQVDLVSMEIPLNIRYSVHKNISVSAGISSVTFLKENYNYNFEYEQQIQVFDDQEESDPGLVTQVVTFSETQQESEPSMSGMEWAAFYTFSAGFQHKFADRHAISFEPFVKIPTGQIASRDIRYTTGGLQLKLTF